MTGMGTVRVAIIGAGFAGIAAALRLRAAGHTDITVFEASPDVGGTWLHNTYPGAACDAPSHIYSYSFAQRAEWSRRFAPGPEILDYLRDCVHDGGIADLIRFNTRVSTARWDGAQWQLELSDGSIHTADVLVPAIGQLNVPAIPSVPGLEQFSGEQFHTAAWRHDVDLAGKRVTVVGTGASAIQVIPEIAPHVEHLTVVQRSAAYVLRKPDGEYSDRLHRIYRAVPALRRIARQMIWGYLELVTLGFTRWPRALSVLERYHEWILRRYVADPVLRNKLRPDYAVGCKRILMSNDYHAALSRPNVTVLTESLDGITESAVVTPSGQHDAEVIIFATGFTTTPLLTGIEIIGCDGLRLHDVWATTESAYLGLSVPGFPNMFLMYGPNTNLGSGSIVYMLEAQAAHITAAVDILRDNPGRALTISDNAFHAFGRQVDATRGRTVWSGCRSWYQDATGRDTHNWPWTMTAYRRRTRRINREHYRLDRVSADYPPYR